MPLLLIGEIHFRKGKRKLGYLGCALYLASLKKPGMLTIKVFTFSPIEENTYLLFNEDKECVVIDPGCYTSNERKILQNYISENGFTLKYLLNTHCHLDHVFGNKFIHETYGLRLHLHPKEEIVLQYAPAAGIKWGLPFENYTGPLCFIQEEDTIELGKDRLKILFTPGHAPGHIVFYCEEQEFLIGGDVLFRGSIGRTDLPLGDHKTLIESIRTKLMVLPDQVTVHPGHGPSTTIGAERMNNPYLV